jgi:hypothetical protein
VDVIARSSASNMDGCRWFEPAWPPTIGHGITTIHPKELAMHPSIAHAIASGIQDPDWRLTDREPSPRRGSSRPSARRTPRHGVATRLRGLLGGRRPDEGQWLSGVVPPLTRYPAQR